MSEDDDRRRRELAASAATLATQVGLLTNRLDLSNQRVADLSARNERLSKRASQHSWWIVATVAGLILDVALTIFLFSSNAELRSTNVRLESSVREQCAFNALVLGSYRPESRPAGPDRDLYEAAFARMRQSYKTLECATPIVPPAVPR